MKPRYFYLVCADSELEISCDPDSPVDSVAYTITEITEHGWET